jgi:hypothetical protein
MASHVRYMLRYGGRMYYGPQVLNVLHDLSLGGPPVKTKEEIIARYKELRQAHKLELWIFREKRHVDVNQSRYKKLCSYHGIGKHKRVKGNQVPPWEAPPQYAVQYAVAHQGARNGRANQQPGLAPAPRRANRGAQAANVAQGGILPQGGVIQWG